MFFAMENTITKHIFSTTRACTPNRWLISGHARCVRLVVGLEGSPVNVQACFHGVNDAAESVQPHDAFSVHRGGAPGERGRDPLANFLVHLVRVQARLDVFVDVAQCRTRRSEVTRRARMIIKTLTDM